MRLDRDGSLGGVEAKIVEARGPERESGAYAKTDITSGGAEEPPARQLDATANLQLSVSETIDKLASLSEQFFLVLQRYTIEQQRVRAVCLEKHQNLQVKKTILAQKLASETYSFGLFTLATSKGKLVASDLEKLTQSLAAIKNALGCLDQPIRAQMESANTLKENLDDQQFNAVSDELKTICDQIAVLLEVCFHLYAQLNVIVPVTSKKGKVGLNSDVWSDLRSGSIQVINLEQFLRVVYLIATQNRHIPASRTNVKKLLINQLNFQNGSDTSSALDDDDHHVADNLMWNLFQAWTEPAKQNASRQ